MENEKATVHFKNEEGKEIVMKVTTSMEGVMDIKVDFGKEGLKPNERGLYIALMNVLMDQLTESK